MMSSPKQRDTQRHICIRIAGYVILLTVYYKTLSALPGRIKIQLPLHPELQKRIDFNLRYATIWNVLFQITYAILSLLCDITTLFQIDSIVPGILRRCRYKYFSRVLFPMAFSVTIFFWSIYCYDRELIYPAISDLIMTKSENVFYHFGVFVFVLWEMVFLPKNCYLKSDGDILIVFLGISAYLVTTLYTGFVDFKSFPYGILNVTLGTIWFYFIFISVPCLYFIGYYIQWRLRDWALNFLEEKSVKVQ